MITSLCLVYPFLKYASGSTLDTSRMDLVFELERGIGISTYESLDSSASSGLVYLSVNGATEEDEDVPEAPVYLRSVTGHAIPFDTIGNSETGRALDLTHGSFLAQLYSSWFISQSPRSFSSLQFVLNPSDVPNRYCRDGYMGYAPVLFGPYLGFKADLSLVDHDESAALITSESVDFHLDFVNGISVPRVIKNGISSTIFATWNMTWTMFEHHPECRTMITQLPTIKFTILDREHRGVVDVHVEPSEYVLIDYQSPGTCHINVATFRSGTQFVGLPFFRSAGVLVDYSQRQIGFCDPL